MLSLKPSTKAAESLPQQAVLRRSGEAAGGGAWSPRQLSAFIRDNDLVGKRVLEMGSNTGGLSLEMARRGARMHSAEPLVDNQVARSVAVDEGLPIEWSKAELFDAHDLGAFDTVVCFGLIYHFRHPQFVLDYLSSLGAPVLYVSTQTRKGDTLALYNRNEKNTIHQREGGVRGYEPTHRLLRNMMRASGFGNIELLTDKEYNRPVPAGLTNTAYYRAELQYKVDPDVMARTFEPKMPR